MESDYDYGNEEKEDDSDADDDLEHALLNLVESVKVEEETSNMMQLFTPDLNLMIIMMIMRMMMIMMIV